MFVIRPTPRPTADERGTSAVEYGLLVGGIAVVIMAAVYGLGEVSAALDEDTCTVVAERRGETC